MAVEGLLPAAGRGGDVDEAGLVTPEAVVLGLPVASVGSRALALLLWHEWPESPDTLALAARMQAGNSIACG